MKRFIVFYIHERYGRYTTTIEENGIEDIVAALNYFNEEYSHMGILGIMEIN